MDRVYKKGYNSNYYIVYTTESKVSGVEKELKELYFGKNYHMKFIAFWGTESQVRIGCLYANECRNVKVRFKILHEVNINQLISIKEGLVKLKDYLLDVKIRKQSLFIGAKQRAGKHAKDILVIYTPIMKSEVHKWLNSFYFNKLMKGKNKTISAPPLPLEEENEYLESIKEFITPVMTNPQLLKINKFSKKFKSYAEAARKSTN